MALPMQAPLDTGPASWGFSGWLGLGVYIAVFVLILIGCAKLARPQSAAERDDETAPPRH